MGRGFGRCSTLRTIGRQFSASILNNSLSIGEVQRERVSSINRFRVIFDSEIKKKSFATANKFES